MRAVCAAILLVLALIADAAATAPPVDVYLFDVGHGDAILVQQGTTEWLIDSGCQSAWDTPEDWACETLAGVTIHKPIEHFILTHDDRDHYSALSDFLSPCGIQTLSTSVMQSASERLISIAECAGHGELSVGRWSSTTDATALLGGSGLRWAVLNPDGRTATSMLSDNDSSLVLLLTFGDVHFLFTGDLESAPSGMEDWALPKGVVILKAPHHGCVNSALANFLDKRFHPNLVVFSTDLCTPNGAEDLLARGVPFLTTARSGLIHMQTDGASVWVTTDSLSGRPTSEQCAESCGGKAGTSGE
jgi:beta-lactamase superfamily II metal-dependent hydrolase